MFFSTGFGLMSLKTAVGTPAASLAPTALVTIGSFARPGSVTSSGRLMPAALTMSGSSRMRPAPNLTDVG
jgi:hypothetical protein